MTLMIRLALLLILPLCLEAAPAITGLTIADDGFGNPDVSSQCVRFTYTTTGVVTSTSVTFETGSTTSLGGGIDSFNIATNYTLHPFDCPVETPGSIQYYKISVGTADTTCPVTCTDCGSADDALFADNSGIDCTLGEPFRVDHPPDASPRTPTAPSHADINPYDDGSGGTVTVTTPASLQADQTATADDGGVQVLDVDLSGGNTLTLSSVWNMTALSGGSTRQVIEPLRTFVLTPYVRVNFNLRPLMLVIRHGDPRLMERQISSGSGIVSVADNVTFLDTIFEADPVPQDPYQFTLTGVSSGTGTSSITFTKAETACPTGVSDWEGWVNLPGMTYATLVSVNACTSTTINVNTSGTVFTGSLSSNGTLTIGVLPIANVTTGSPIQVDFSAPHGLPCDGTPSGLDQIFINRVNGQTAANGTFNFTCVDADSVTLDGTVSAAAFTSSPYAFARFYSNVRRFVIEAANTSGVHFGRTVVGNLGDGSWGAGDGIVLANSSDGFVFRDGAVFSTTMNCVIHSDGTQRCGPQTTRAADYFRFDGASDFYVGNNLLSGCAGICFDAQQFANPVSDVTITQNHIIATDRPFTDYAGNGYWTSPNNLWGTMRHLIEIKNGCYRCAITHNLFDGMGEADQNAPYAILITDTTGSPLTDEPPRRGVDIDISHNYFRNIATPFGLIQQNLSNPIAAHNRSFSNRIRFSDNFIQSKFYELRISPNGSGAAATSSPGGYQFTPRRPTQDLLVTNNAWFGPNSGSNGGILIGLGGGRAAGCVVENNIFTWHQAASGAIAVIGSGAGFTPYTTTTNQTRFDTWCPGGSFQNNLIISGVEDPTQAASSAKQDSTNDSDTKTQTECQSAFGSSTTFTGRLCAAGASYSARHAEVFGGDQVQEASYTSYGPDMSALRVNVFREITEDSFSFSQTSSTAATVSWTAWTTSGCTVWLTNDDWATATSQTDASSSTSQSVSFTGLTAGGTYKGFVGCPGSVPYPWGPKTLQ